MLYDLMYSMIITEDLQLISSNEKLSAMQFFFRYHLPVTDEAKML